MKPEESTNTFKFLKAVYDSEKEALKKECSARLKFSTEANEEDIKIEQIIFELKRRLCILSENENNDGINPHIIPRPLVFSCPRCLVHTASPHKMEILIQIPNGEMELNCPQCNLSYSPIETSQVPAPSVPLKLR